MHNNYIPNTSSIPNILFDYWMTRLSPAEFKVLMCIARKTYGWNKSRDLISIKQIEGMTGLHRSGIIKNVDKLVEIGLVNKVKSKTSDGDDAPNRFEINVYCVEGGSLHSRPPVVDSVDYGVVYSVDPQNPIYTKPNTTNNTPPTPPQKNSEAPKGAEVQSELPSKPKKPKREFSTQVHEVLKKMIDIVIKHNPVYRPPQDLSKFLIAVEDLIEKEKQDIEVMLRAFEWAVEDHEERAGFKGWSGIICTNNKGGKPTNPAEIFKKYFSKIHAQMASKPKRKFDACSDSDAAYEAIASMNASAL